MSGLSRDRGNREERRCAKLLSAVVPEGRVVTTRDARGGAQGGADLCWVLDDGSVRADVLGWSVEVKEIDGKFPTPAVVDGWFGQAVVDAREFRPVVMFRQCRRRDGWVVVSDRDGWSVLPQDVWLGRLGRDGEW